MGPYCRFCQRRCFVLRYPPSHPDGLLMATCGDGVLHDQEAVGASFSTASAMPRQQGARDGTPTTQAEP